MSDQVSLSNLQDAMDYIAAHFVFDEASYPLLQKLTSEERLQFSINHSLQHMMKQLGRIATHLEDKDHGGAGNPELLGLHANELLSKIPKVMKH